MVVKRTAMDRQKIQTPEPGGPTLRGGRPLSPGSQEPGSRATADDPAATDRRGPVRTALDESVAAAGHLSARDAAAVAAARALADKIDAWDVIVEWALDDLAGDPRPGKRPAVPQNDNVSLSALLKYLEVLQLVPPAAAKAKPGPASQASDSQQELNAMRQALALVPEVG